MKTILAPLTFLYMLFVAFPLYLSGQTSNIQFSVEEHNENSILVKCRFSDELPETLKPSCLIALPGETFESVDVKKIEIRGSYVSSSRLKDQFISNTSIIQIRGCHLLKIEFDPFIKLKNKFPISAIEVEIKFGKELPSETSQRLRNHHWDKLVKNLVINPDDVAAGDLQLPTKDEDGAEYLIITHDLFLENCQELIDFRIQQGIQTLAVPTSITGSTTEEIKAYIHDAYNTWTIPPSAVLLVGDWELLPGEVWQGYCASDNMYADVNQDELPDLIISRIPVKTVEELGIIIQKIISHETNPPTNPDYYQHPLACADHSNPGSFGWMVSEIFNGWYEKESGKEPNRQYTGYSPGPIAWPHPDLYQVFGPDGLDYIPESPEYLGNYIGGNAQGINAGLNSGAMTLFSYTHGNTVGWSAPAYYTSDLAGLTDAGPTYLISLNDLNGKYNSSADCFAEAFLKHPHGGIGAIAPSEVGYAFGREWFSIGLIDGMWDDFYPYNNPANMCEFIYPCMANTSAKYFLEFLPYPISPNMKSSIYNLFHYFGEPYSVLFDDVPQELNVIHAEYISPGQTEFSVTSNEGSTVALVLNDEICSVETATGNLMSMPINEPLEGDTLHVTVTKHNHARYHAQILCQTGIGIEEQKFADHIDIFPNPANQQFQIQFNKEINGLITITLTDLYGREISVSNYKPANVQKNNFLILVDELDAGVYILNINTESFSRLEKIIVRH